MIRAVLTDIEGTTSSISFVKDILFPYAREHMAEFIESHALDPHVRKLLDDVCTESGRTLNGKEVIAQLVQWIDADKKITPLKTLQGMLWEKGYQQGDFTGHIYKDAVDKLQDWNRQGIKLYVYSSGSVAAQKLLFNCSDFGDLTPLFSGYFDTNIGDKREAKSYQAIAKEISIPANEILFLSDIEEELNAAKKAGMQTIRLVREEDGTKPSPGHHQVASFAEITF